MPSPLAHQTVRLQKQYWLTRQWIYAPSAPAALDFKIKPESTYVVDQSGRPLTADDRKVELTDFNANPEVASILLATSFIQFHQCYQDQVQHGMRPIISKLLKLMWSKNGQPVLLDEVCRQVWGRPVAPSYHTFHATVQKANAVLRQAGGSLRLKSRLNQMIFVVL